MSASAASPSRREAARVAGAAVRVLVVDDEAAIRELVRDRLVRNNYEVDIAASAAEAGELLEERPYDLLLCDVLMPGRSGLDLVREALTQHDGLGTIMMSGLDDPDVAESALALGAYGYLVKPFSANQLLIQMRNAALRLKLERADAAKRAALERLLAERTEALGRERHLTAMAERQSRENARLVASLQARQALLERLTVIQQSISRRAPLPQVLDSVVDGAAQLIGDEVVVLHLPRGREGGPLAAASSRGLAPGLLEAVADVPAGADPGAHVVELLSAHAGVHAAVAAPVHERGAIAGSLVVGSRADGRSYTDAEREALEALAAHAGIALADARSLDAVHAAFHDRLTGLPNRARFLERLEQPNGRIGGVLVLDIDNFRAITETRGHAVGDDVLAAVGARLRECIDGHALLARIGVDEFGVILDDGQDPEALADRLVGAVETPFAIGQEQVAITASVGVVGPDSTRSQDLLGDASIALYRAKRRGKSRWERFSVAMQRALLAQFELEAEVEGAAERGEIRVAYQPLVDIQSGRVVAFEALARWEHPRRGLLPPAEFIPLAEELGVVATITRCVLATALGQLARWRASTSSALWVSVNLSAHDLEREDLVSAIEAELARFGVPPDALLLEITETALIGDFARAREQLRQLRELGVGVAIDDFGTGHASLEYLRQLPFGTLKIAQSYSAGADGSAEEAALVKTVLSLAEGYGLRVIAEGIERRSQQLALAEMGCGLGQGYHFARPLDPATAEIVIPETLGARRSPSEEISA